MVHANLRLQNIDTLPPAKLAEYRSYFKPFFSVKNFSPEFRCEHDVILTVPGGVCQRMIISILHCKILWLFVMQVVRPRGKFNQRISAFHKDVKP
jgi:hypothetical protein